MDPLNYTGKYIHQRGSKYHHGYASMGESDMKQGNFAVHPNASEDAALPYHPKCYSRMKEGLVGLFPYSTRLGDQIVIFKGWGRSRISSELVTRSHLAKNAQRRLIA